MMFKDRSQTHLLEALFRERVMPNTTVQNPEDFWAFVEGRVAPFLRGDELAGSSQDTMFGNLKIVTGVRLRQVD